MQYKEYYKAETYFSFPQEAIGLSVSVSIGRTLTTKEQSLISEHARAIMAALRLGSREHDPETKERARLQREELVSCFPDKRVYARKTENEYSKDPLEPWYKVVTNMGEIKIGWRKRVIVIDWTNSDIKELAKTIFPFEETTTGDFMIHAWGREKAKEYIKTLLSFAPEEEGV